MRKHGKKCFLFLERKKKFEEQIKIERAEKFEKDGKIKCEFCDYWGFNLKIHLEKIHGINIENYKKETLAHATRKRYRKQNIENGNWINRAKENNLDLKEYFVESGKAISKAIMNNPFDRRRRSELLGKLNKREDFRKKASETAIKTSKRKDLIEKRTTNLLNWVKNNPEEHYNKCIKKKFYVSKPEMELYKYICKYFKNLDFKNNQQLKNKKWFLINKTNRRQIDILSKKEKIIIEFDGIFHFKKIGNKQKFLKIVEKDKELDNFAFKNNWTLIRVGNLQYSYKAPSGFKESCLLLLKNIIDNRDRGVFKIGLEYGKDNIL